jgi:hypothetical protein
MEHRQHGPLHEMSPQFEDQNVEGMEQFHQDLQMCVTQSNEGGPKTLGVSRSEGSEKPKQ